MLADEDASAPVSVIYGAWGATVTRFETCFIEQHGLGSNEREQGGHMSDTTIRDRAAGAVMGAFIGDAMGLGPHWYYDLAELRRDYGEWISDYTDPRPGRYDTVAVVTHTE